MRARADIRARPISLILVTILVGSIGALGITAFAGARRTASTYDRYRAASLEPEASALGCAGGVPWPPVDMDAIGRLPMVAASATGSAVFAYALDAEGQPLIIPPENDGLMGIAVSETLSGGSFEPKVLAGRLPAAADEIAVGYGASGLRRPDVGERITLRLAPQALIDSGHFPSPKMEAIDVPVTVVGHVLMPGELTGDQAQILLTPAFVTAHPEAWACDVGIFRLTGGLPAIPAFVAAETELAPNVAGSELSGERLFVERTTRLQSIVLLVLSVLAGFAGIMVLGQSLVRRTTLAAIDTPVLRAIGMTTGEIVRAAVLPAAIVALGGSLIAVIGAIISSGLFPVGVLRVAEPNPGIRVDPGAIALGLGVIVVTTLLSVAIPARWMASARNGVDGTIEYRGAERRSALASWIGRLPLPPSAGAGARLALEPGHGRSATPVRSTLIGLVIAIVAMVASFGFSASMQHFGSKGSLSGSSFDFAGGAPFSGSQFQDLVIPKLRSDPRVQDLEAGNFQLSLVLKGPASSTLEAAWGFESLKGTPVRTTMLEGRWPRTPDEIAVGRESLSLLGLKVGDTVSTAGSGITRTLTIVGIPVFPDFGFGPGLGRGIAITMDGLRAFYPDVTQNLAVGKVTPGTDPVALTGAINAQLPKDFNGILGTYGDIRGTGTTIRATLQSGSLPLKLSLLFVFAAFATLIHLLLTSVRRRRRDLAILQTLGFKRGQIVATVAWQALILTGMALAIGIPIGILAGRLAWSAFAYRLGVVPEPVLSTLSAIMIPLVLAVALIVAVGPGLVARRTRPAEVLKAE
jgi:ABC-type antimicrobial peptide transport system permease subunit